METLTGFCERLVAAGVHSAARQPVAAVMPFAVEAEAVELANDTIYILAAYLIHARHRPGP